MQSCYNAFLEDPVKGSCSRWSDGCWFLLFIPHPPFGVTGLPCKLKSLPLRVAVENLNGFEIPKPTVLLLPVKADLPPISLLLLEDPEMTLLRKDASSPLFLTFSLKHTDIDKHFKHTVSFISFITQSTQYIHKYLLSGELDKVLDKPVCCIYQIPDSGEAY